MSCICAEAGEKELPWEFFLWLAVLWGFRSLAPLLCARCLGKGDNMTDEELKAAMERLGGTAAGWSKTKIAACGGAILLILALICGLAWLWHKNNATEEAMQKAVTMTAAQAANSDYLQNELKISKQNADAMAAAVKAAQAGNLAPSVTFVQTAPTVDQAAGSVAQRINDGDKTLPSMALEKTDRTAVVPQEVVQKDGSKEWQVGVYKVNNYRNWEWSAGYGRHGGDSYIPLGLQRNYSKDHAIAAEYHIGGKGGYEIKYVVKTDKLFGLF